MLEFNPLVNEKEEDFDWKTKEQREKEIQEIKAETKRILEYMNSRLGK